MVLENSEFEFILSFFINNTLSNNVSANFSYIASIFDEKKNGAPINTNDIIHFTFFEVCSILRLITILIGLVGNLVSFKILTNPKFLSSTNVYISSLCFSSFFALLGDLCILVAQLLLVYANIDSFIFRLYPFIYPLILTFQLTCIYLTVAVQINQFCTVYFTKVVSNSIVRDIQLAKECKRAFYIVISIFLFSTIYCLPFWFIYEYSDEYRSIVHTSIGKNPLFNWLIHYAFYLIVVYLIPVTVLSLINMYLIYFLVKTKNKKDKLLLRNYRTFKETRIANDNVYRNAEEDRVKKHRVTTIMLILIVFSFIACQLPNLILHVLESKRWNSSENEPNAKENYLYFKTISRLLIVFYLSFNFAYYACFNRMYLDKIKEFFSKFSM